MRAPARTGLAGAVARGLAAAALAVAGSASAAASCPRDQPHCIDDELLADLTGWAARVSGLPAAPPGLRPGLQALPAHELARTVCGGDGSDCRGLAAVYDTDSLRILYLDTLDMRDATDQSFVVHELVHFLQHRQSGGKLHETCDAVMASEREAYAAQNRYLERFKQWRRVGDILRSMRCADAATAAAVEPSLRPAALPAAAPGNHTAPAGAHGNAQGPR